MIGFERISPQQLESKLISDERCRLIDVREYDEFHRQHVTGAECVPAGQLLHRAGEWSPVEPLILICNRGPRAEQAAAALGEVGFSRLYVVDGGTQRCVREQLPITAGRRTLALQRQILIAAGGVVLTGLAVSLFYGPAVVLSWFAASMLIVAGITGFCPMARLLAKAPWNQPATIESVVQENMSCPAKS